MCFGLQKRAQRLVFFTINGDVALFKSALAVSTAIGALCCACLILFAPYVAAVEPVERFGLQITSMVGLLGIGFLLGIAEVGRRTHYGDKTQNMRRRLRRVRRTPPILHTGTTRPWRMAGRSGRRIEARPNASPFRRAVRFSLQPASFDSSRGDRCAQEEHTWPQPRKAKNRPRER